MTLKPPGAANSPLLEFEPVIATDYGVHGDGVSDDALALQNMLTHAASKKALIPSGTYRVLSGLTLPSAVTLQLDDVILDFSSLAASGTALTQTGTIGTPVAVNAVAFGATSITGSAGIEAGLSAGSYIKLFSADVFDPGRTASTHGEQCEVLSTSSGVINLRSPVMGVYSTTVKIAKITHTFLKIQGSGQIILGGSGSNHRAMQLHQTRKLRIGGGVVAITGAEEAAVRLYDCLDFDIAGMDIEGSDGSSTGYGISVANASQFGRVHHSNIRRCGHCTSMNNSPSENGGIPRHVAWEDNECRDSVTDCMDSHAAAEYITWARNKIYDAGNVGINVECPKATLEDNEIFRPGNHGIYMLNCAATAAEYRALRNEVYDGPQMAVRYGALVGGGSSTPVVLDILDNVGVRCAFACTWADPGVEHRLVGARMLRNRAYDCAGSGTRVFYMQHADACEMENTSIKTPNAAVGSYGEDFTDGKFGGLTDFVSAGTGKGHYGVGMLDTIVKPQTRNAGGVGCEGIELDATSARCRIETIGVKNATNPVQLNGVTSHTVVPIEGILLYSTDANRTLIPWQDPTTVIHSATLTAGRLMPIATANAYAGMRYRVTRTGGGGFTVTVAGVKALATSQWVEVVFDGTAWVEAEFGSL